MSHGSKINRVELNCQHCGKTFESEESVCGECYELDVSAEEKKVDSLEDQLTTLQEKYDALKAIVCNCTECSSKAVVENL